MTIDDRQRTVTAIELGTSTIKLFMGRPLEDDSMAVLGAAELPSGNSIVKGEITDVAAIADMLSNGLNELEKSAGERIGLVYLGITGSHVASTNFRGSVPVTTPDRVITEEAVIESTRHARACSLPLGKKEIHTFQRTYLIDNSRRTADPIGMVGNQLTADIHAIYGNETNLLTPFQLIHDILGRPPNDIVFNGIANFYGLATSAEERNGILIIDIGAGVTEYVVFFDGGCMHSGQVTVGTEHIANDLAIGLRLPISRCREIVTEYGRAERRADGNNRVVKVEMSIGYPPKSFNENVLHTIIELRMRELFDIIKNDIDKQDISQLIGNGIILCGGGALIEGMDKLAARVFGSPVRIGEPGNVSGAEHDVNSPRFVTPVGLLHLGHRLRQMDESDSTWWETTKQVVGEIGSLAKRAIRL